MERTRTSLPPGTLLRGGSALTGLVFVAALVVGFGAAALPSAQPARTVPEGLLGDDLVATFSVVAFDADTGDLGVAVQSKFFAVGRVVPFAAAGVGAIATQAYANTTFGPRGLRLLRQGTGPQAVIDRLLADDPGRDGRQLGLVDAAGNTASFTGEGCLPWSGGRSGEGYTVQGNLLAGPEVVEAMAEAFEAGSGDLASRLVAALAAGQAAGGDVRGRQSAALLVVREGAGYGGFDDRYIDLRVDDHETPIRELQRLLDVRHGMLAAESSRRLLRAAETGEEERASLLDRAVREARSATSLNDGDGWSWMTLAETLLATGDLEAAGSAGIKALAADPWIKAAVLHGVGGSIDLIEELLHDDSFRRTWEAVPVR